MFFPSQIDTLSFIPVDDFFDNVDNNKLLLYSQALSAWVVNESKTMVIEWHDANPNLKIYIKHLNNASDWVDIGVPLYKGDDLYEFVYSFDTVGDYIVKVVNLNNDEYIIDRLSIVDDDIQDIFKRTVVA